MCPDPLCRLKEVLLGREGEGPAALLEAQQRTVRSTAHGLQTQRQAMRATATTTSGEEPALRGQLSQAHIQGHGGGGGRLLEGRGEEG